MSCVHNDYTTGLCSLNEDGVERPVNKKGVCMCDEDENTIDACEDFEEV